MTKIYVVADGSEFSSKEAAMEYQTAADKLGEEFAAKRKEFLKLQENLGRALDAQLSFQEECSHEYVTLEPKSDTGNYDRSQDCYWFTIECKCCNKRWDEDQDKSKYSMHGNDKRVEVIRR